MTREQTTISTQLRIAPDLYGYVQSNAERLGMSQNAFMLILMDLGRKAYETKPVICLCSEDREKLR